VRRPAAGRWRRSCRRSARTAVATCTSVCCRSARPSTAGSISSVPAPSPASTTVYSTRKWCVFLPALLHASVAPVLAIALRLSVCLSVCLCLCLSVTSRCSIKSDERINLVFGMGTSFHQPYTVFKEIQISTKIGYLPLGLFPKLRTYKISPRHIDRRSVLST